MNNQKTKGNAEANEQLFNESKFITDSVKS